MSECKLSDDCQTVAVGQLDGIISFYDLEKNQKCFSFSETVRPWQHDFETKNPKIQFLSENEILTSSANRIKIYDLRIQEQGFLSKKFFKKFHEKNAEI